RAPDPSPPDQVEHAGISGSVQYGVQPLSLASHHAHDAPCLMMAAPEAEASFRQDAALCAFLPPAVGFFSSSGGLQLIFTFGPPLMTTSSPLDFTVIFPLASITMSGPSSVMLASPVVNVIFRSTTSIPVAAIFGGGSAACDTCTAYF